MLVILPYVRHICTCILKLYALFTLAFSPKFSRFWFCYIHEAVLRLMTFLKKESMVAHEDCTCNCEFCADGCCNVFFAMTSISTGTWDICSVLLQSLPKETCSNPDMLVFAFANIFSAISMQDNNFKSCRNRY